MLPFGIFHIRAARRTRLRILLYRQGQRRRRPRTCISGTAMEWLGVCQSPNQMLLSELNRASASAPVQSESYFRLNQLQVDLPRRGISLFVPKKTMVKKLFLHCSLLSNYGSQDLQYSPEDSTRNHAIMSGSSSRGAETIHKTRQFRQETDKRTSMGLRAK